MNILQYLVGSNLTSLYLLSFTKTVPYYHFLKAVMRHTAKTVQLQQKVILPLFYTHPL